MSVSSRMYEDKVDRVNTYLALVNAPESLRTNARLYFAFHWSKQHGIEEGNILDILPSPLHDEITIWLNRSLSLISALDIFNFPEASREFIKSIMAQLRHRAYLPGDSVINRGDMAQCLFILTKGNVEVIDEDGINRLTTYSSIMAFNEMGLFFHERSRISVVSPGISEIAVLSRSSFEQVISRFPNTRSPAMRKVEEAIAVQSKLLQTIRENLTRVKIIGLIDPKVREEEETKDNKEIFISLYLGYLFLVYCKFSHANRSVSCFHFFILIAINFMFLGLHLFFYLFIITFSILFFSFLSIIFD